MKLIIKTMGMITLLLTSAVNADVKCPEGKIQSLYQTEEKVFIQLEGQGWQVLAMKSEKDMQKKMAHAMKAQRLDMNVELSFPNGYDETCLTTDTSVVAKKIKLIKSKGYKE